MWLVSGLLVLCTVLPFVILNKSGKGDLKIMSNEVKKLINESKLKFNLKESWGNSFIGLDADNRTLVFSKVFDGIVAVENINLNDVLNAKIVKKTHVTKTNNKKETVLERMDLEIKFLDESREHKILNFYDIESIYMEDYELSRAEKWNAAVNGVVATSLKRARVA